MNHKFPRRLKHKADRAVVVRTANGFFCERILNIECAKNTHPFIYLYTMTPE